MATQGEALDPKPGDRFIRNGRAFTVQMREGDVLYGVLYRADADPEETREAIRLGLQPPAYLGNCRVTVADLESELAARANLAGAGGVTGS